MPTKRPESADRGVLHVRGGHAMTDPRRTRAWRKLRDQVVREEPVCRLQFPGICTGVSTTGDHIIAVEERPDLALVRSNVRGVCWPCNKRRGSMPDALLRLDRAEPDALKIFG